MTTIDRYEVAGLLELARSGPVGLAEVAGRGEYKAAAHHLLLERELLHTIATGGRLIVSVSVRSGKTQLLSRWAPAWFIGRWPKKRVILGSHEVDFARSHGRFARDVLTEHGATLFGTEIDDASASAARWDTTEGGGMICVGIGGAPIGRGADLMVIDDPHPNFRSAMSETERKGVHQWWTGTLRSRLQPGAAVVVVCSRWHEDDISGYLMENFPDDWREVRIPALCDDPENDPLGRSEGEALWPEAGWTVEEYQRARKETTAEFGEMVWMAQYQGRATRPQGDMFKADKWQYVDDDDEILEGVRWVRAWDLAATDGSGDWTVGAKVGIGTDERTYIADVVRGQWGADEVVAQIQATGRADGRRVPVAIPQDPGQAGKAQFQQLSRKLRGHRVIPETNTGDKKTRAWPLASQQRTSNVVLVRAPWNKKFTTELEGFPTGRHDDQVDAAASGYNAGLSTGRGGLRA